MPLTLLHNATTLVTMDAQRREIADGALLIDGQEILWVGRSEDLPMQFSAEVKQRIDARGKLVLPGFVNTHHHFYQTLTRVIPAAQDAVLFD